MSLAVVEAVQKGKYQPYPEYKNSGSTWFSDLPSHWTRILLKRVVLKVCDGTHGTYPRVNDGMPLLSAKNVFSDGLLISDSESQISFEHHSEIVSNGFPAKDDVLVTCVGTIGRCYVYDFDYPMAFQRSVAFLRLIDLAVPQFYKYYIESHPYQSQLKSIVKSSAQGGVYMGDLVATESVLPPKEEQCSIAAFLDYETARIDRLIAKQQQLIELLKEKRQAVISHAVTKGLNPNAPMKDSGVEWLGQVPEHWQIQKTAWHFTAQKGRNGQMLTKEYCGENSGDYPVYSGQTENNGIMGRIDSFEFDFGNDGCLFSTTVGAKAMSLSLLKGKFSLSQNCMVIIPRENNAFSVSFAFYHFQPLFSYERGLIPEHMQASFRMDDLYQYSIAMPPVSEQIEISDFINGEVIKIDYLVQIAEKAITLMQERRSALISAAVTGKIDLRGWTQPAEEVAA